MLACRNGYIELVKDILERDELVDTKDKAFEVYGQKESITTHPSMKLLKPVVEIKNEPQKSFNFFQHFRENSFHLTLYYRSDLKYEIDYKQTEKYNQTALEKLDSATREVNDGIE